MTNRRLLRAAAAAALAFAGAAGGFASPASAQAAQRDWTRTIAATPAGGVRMGNPAAAIKLVEYVSLTCPHCRTFAQEGIPALLAGKVRSGEVSLELRNYVLNPIDEAAAVLSRCAATPAHYWALSEAMLAEQPEWVGRLTEAEYHRISALPDNQRLVQFAAATGLDAIAARHGVTAARARACLTDPARLAQVRAMKEAGTAAGVTGTPTFTINGGAAFPLDWAGLEPLLVTGE
jgi:protein-disulfide isomerase